LITIILLLGLLYFLLRSNFDKLRCATTKTQDTACTPSPQTPLQQRRTPEPRPRDWTECRVFQLLPTTRELMQPHWTCNQNDLGNISLFTANAENFTHQTERSQVVPCTPTDLTCCWIHQWQTFSYYVLHSHSPT